MVYVGGHLIENLLFYRSQEMGGRSQVLRTIRAGEPAINVAAPVMILSGVALVIFDEAWRFTSPFVLIGIGAIAISALVGLPILKEIGALEELIEEQGETTEVGHRYTRVSAWWSALAVVYLVAAWAMVFKP